MKKVIYGIFAHPDDEAFGPAGTLLSEVANGAELHLISFSAGQNGANPDNVDNLEEVRLKEWERSGELLGATKMHYLGYIDGEIGNSDMLNAVDRIKGIIYSHAQSIAGPFEIEFVSMDINGVTGHIDHIVVSRAVHHIFYDLKKEGLPVVKLRLSCIPRSQTGDTPSTEFVYMEPGREASEIGDIVDNTQYRDQVIEVMKVHKTQREDCEYHLRKLGSSVAIDYFLVVR